MLTGLLYGQVLIFQRNDGPFALTVRRDALEAAARLGKRAYRAITIHRVAVFGEIPTATFTSMLRDVIHWGP